MILVTTAGGTVGGAALAALRAAGAPVRAGYHAPERAERERAAGHDAVAFDLADAGSVSAAVAGVDAVLLVTPTGPEQAEHEVGVVRAAAAAGAARVVKVSVWRAPEELTPFAEAAHHAEQAVEASGLGWAFLRPSFYMQNFTRRHTASIRDRDRFAQPDPGAPVHLVDARDVGAAAAAVLTGPWSDRAVYDLTGPAALTNDDAAGVLARVLGRRITFAALTGEEARTHLLAAGVHEYHVEGLVRIAGAYRDGGASEVTTAVRDLTGREPASFEAFVREHAALFTPRPCS